MDTIISIARDKLKENIDEKTLATAQNFFKEKIKSHGVKVPVVHKISKDLPYVARTIYWNQTLHRRPPAHAQNT